MAFLETSWDEERREVWEGVLECLARRPDRDGEAACRTLLANLGRTGSVHGYFDSLERLGLAEF